MIQWYRTYHEHSCNTSFYSKFIISCDSTELEERNGKKEYVFKWFEWWSSKDAQKEWKKFQIMTKTSVKPINSINSAEKPKLFTVAIDFAVYYKTYNLSGKMAKCFLWADIEGDKKYSCQIYPSLHYCRSIIENKIAFVEEILSFLCIFISAVIKLKLVL